MAKATDDSARPLAVAVLTVSDTRTEDTDTSGQYLLDALATATIVSLAVGALVANIVSVTLLVSDTLISGR